MHRRTIPGLALLALTACGGRAASTDDAASPHPPPSYPLAALAGQRLLILPVRYYSATDSLGWSEQVGQSLPYLRELDREIAAALERRGLGSNWMFGERIIEVARRNRSMVADPAMLPAERFRTGRLIAGNMVADPLASQLRALGALADARLVLLPVELRLENHPGGAQPVLRVVLIDPRTAMIRFSGEIEGEPAATLPPALRTSLAERFADLFAAP